MALLSNSVLTPVTIRLEQRKSFTFSASIKVEPDTPADITGCSFRFVVQRSRHPYDTVVESAPAVIDVATGYIRFDLQASELDLDPGSYPYVVVLISPDKYSRVIIKGNVEVLANPEMDSVYDIYDVGVPLEGIDVYLRGDHAVTVRTGLVLPPGYGLLSDQDKDEVHRLLRDGGPQGVKGDKGDKGDRGDPGLQGTQGFIGLQGVKGDKGDKGEKGEKGDKGEKGEKGDKGDKGDNGDPGLQGVKGDKGDPGLQGVKGDKGDTGLQGVKGDKGDTGLQGLPGADGAPGTTSWAGITGKPAVIAEGATAAAARTAIGAGTSNLTLGTTGATALAGNTAIPVASSTTPANLGASAAVGSGATFARADHVHKRPTLAELGAAATTHAHVAGDVTGGVFAPARLGSGTASVATVLRGDGSWGDVPGMGDVAAALDTILNGA